MRFSNGFQHLCVTAALAVGAFVVFSFSPSAAHAQGGLAIHVGTMGFGADGGYSFGRAGLRAGINWLPGSVDFTQDDFDVTADLPPLQITAMIDIFLAGSFRVSGGIFVSGKDPALAGTPTTSVVEVGDTVYTAAEVGTVFGAIDNNTVGPYFGIGFGNVGGSRVGFFLDLGVAYQGKPAVSLTADGTAGSDPTFQANLDQEAQDIEDDISIFAIYPVISIGVAIGLGGGM